jgi:hypothetical protein
VTATLRDSIETTLQKQFGKWMTALTESGEAYDDWPYDSVKVKVVGWAVKDRSTLKWTDDSVDIYAGDLDADGVPRCAPPCDRSAHQDGDYSQCPGEEAHHFDQSLWLTKGMGFGGFGGDWGQQLDQEYFTDNLDAENLHIYLHEVGHTFGLDDFYDWSPPSRRRSRRGRRPARELVGGVQAVLARELVEPVARVRPSAFSPAASSHTSSAAEMPSLSFTRSGSTQ